MTQPTFTRAVVVLPVADMRAARAWYAESLGFETVYLHSDPEEDPVGNYAILRRDAAEVHLMLDEPPREHPWSTAGTGYLYLLVQGIDDVYDQAQARGIRITQPLGQESWGARAFRLTDPSGNSILVAEEVKS